MNELSNSFNLNILNFKIENIEQIINTYINY